ncbi:hypothetical protein GCM10017687_29190 [Streptomyces echinatus]
MARQTTPPAPGSPTPGGRSAISRRHFLGTGSALTAGALAAGVGALSGRAQAADGTLRADPADLSPAHWIWYPEGDPAADAPAEHRYFRTAFTVAEGEVTDAALVVTGDDTVDVWLNGEYLTGSPRVAHSWREALYVDLRTAVRPGANTLALASRNQGGPAGVIGRVRVLTSGGTTDVVTDARWSAGKEAPEGWERPGFGDAGWPAARDLGAYGTAPWYTSVAGPDLTAASPLVVAAGTVEHRAGPLGIDTARPRFGWKLDSSAPQQRQAGYRIQVSSTADGTGDLWDSGRVSSHRQIDIPYDGAHLVGLTRYFWRVRVWDTQGRAGSWSAPRWFETGLLPGSDEWPAAFIGRPPGPDLSGAGWIWYPEGDPAGGRPAETRCFRRTFTLTGAPAAATLLVTGDDTADVWVNGALVSASPRVTDSWKSAAVVDVTARLTIGANTIAVASRNTSQSPAGLIAKLTVTGGPTVVTDATWKASRDAPAGWQTPGYDDGSWPAARVVASYGGGPWGSGVRVVGPAPMLRKSFTVRGPVVSARLLTTALGLHETRLNGARVGDQVLAPGWTDYAKRLQYQVFDVTARIRQGANALGAWLGNGWYSGSLGFAGSRRYGTQPWYSAQLVITFADGTTQRVTTDGGWRTSTGAITADDLYDGETYDARLHITGWDGADFDDGDWTPVTVRDGAAPRTVAQVDNGVSVRQEFRPVRITQPTPGVWILDLGQNLTGWNRIALRGEEGTTVTVRHGEVLNPDGTLYTANLRAARATDRFTLAGTGDVETYEPRFTVHGYRYVELTGLPAGFTPDEDTVTGRAVWTDAAQPGTFRSSDPLLDRLQHNIVWGERGNMLSIPTDCPQRDERLGWTGDIAAFCATSTFNLDTHAFLAKFTDDLTDAQQADGAFTDVAPAVIGGSGTAGWGDAGTIIPYTPVAALRRPDRRRPALRGDGEVGGLSARHRRRRPHTRPADLRRLAQRQRRHRAGPRLHGLLRLVGAPGLPHGRGHGPAGRGRVVRTARRPGRGGLHRALRRRRRNRPRGNTQTGYVLALAFGLLPASLVQPAADKLAARVAAAGGHLSVGFLGVENLLPVLADHGHADTAYRALLQRGFPGWGVHDRSRCHHDLGALGRHTRRRLVQRPGHELVQPLRARLGRRLPLPPGRRTGPRPPRLRRTARRPAARWRADLRREHL